jgi:riboflavin synthase
MFTGLIEATGTIAAIRPEGAGSRLQVETSLAAGLAEGDSIAVNGVCLTVVAMEGPRLSFEAVPETLRRTNLGLLEPGSRVDLERAVSGHFEADLSPETLRVTTLGGATAGRIVNLERPLAATDRLGGHFVLGHVDATGSVRGLENAGDCFWLEAQVPDTLAPYLIPKGSIAIDGISLTIATLLDDGVRVQIVPFTWSRTTLSSARVGDALNLEADVIGKYVARLLGDRATLVRS